MWLSHILPQQRVSDLELRLADANSEIQNLRSLNHQARANVVDFVLLM